MSKHFKSAGPNIVVILLLGLFARLFKSKNTILHTLKSIGEISNYLIWVKSNFEKSKLFSRREALWNYIIQKYDLNELNSLVILEFGVAWGYATNWWTKRITNQSLVLHGFDTFTGLPRSWRNLEPGHFSNNGLIPLISDKRVTFHKGLVENTLIDIHNLNLQKGKCLILFDFDLYEPTRYCLDYLWNHLKNGDIIYFDEAFDGDENKILNEILRDIKQPQKKDRVINLRLIGITPSALAVEIIK